MAERITRRRFLAHSTRSAILGAALSGRATNARAARGLAGANDRVRLGWIGCGLRCRVMLPVFLQHADVDVPALCDVHRPRLELERKRAQDNGRPPPDLYGDYRRILDRKDIDAVVVATPEHWKCLPTIDACEAGKDVYVEKPLARTIVEGRLMVEAARRHDRIVMIGTQQRGIEAYREAVEFIQSGRLGRISEVRSWNFENRAPGGFGKPRDADPPPGLDWDMWLGPAPTARFNPNRYGQFHFFWDYGGGWQVDWAVHMYDVVHWAMKVDAPRAVVAAGGKFASDDNTEHPDTFEAVFEYPGFVSMYSYRRGNGRLFEDMWYGNAFYGENGTLAINRDGWRVIPEPHDSHDPGKGLRMAGLKRPGTPVEGPYQRTFIDAVKARKRQAAGDVLDGHRSTIPGLLANIAFRIGRKVHWDAQKERITDGVEANRLLTPNYRAPWTLPRRSLEMGRNNALQ